MKTKLITLTLSAVLAASLLALTACGTTEEATVSSTVESSVISETSASLGIYIQDTDNDGIPDMVVDKHGNDLSHLYTIKEDGIYEGETLVLPIGNTQVYVPVTEIAFTVENKTVHPDTEFTLDLVITPEDATTKEFELTTDNAEVLKIENGNITALANGEATVTATAKAGSATATCKVIVNSEAEETQTQNEEVAASGGAVNNSTGSTSGNSNVSTNTNTGNNTTYTPPSNGNNGGNTNTGTTTPPQQQQQQQTAAPAPQPQVHAPVYKQVWVVDQAAWSEEVPVWGNKLVWICNTCGADITDDVYGHIDITMHGGYHDNMIKVQTGTQTIHHDEVGHWESVLVCGGCTGTH